MRILEFFRKEKDEVIGARVLVCSFDSKFDDLLNKDSSVYAEYFRATKAVTVPSIESLRERLEEKYDIVHLLSDVTESGAIKDHSGCEITGTELIHCCCEHDVKLLWAASDNAPERYIRGFGARGQRLNLVMTIKRRATLFSSFLKRLLSQMASGSTMPVAWSNSCPQIPHSDDADMPESIFFAGRGGVKLLR